MPTQTGARKLLAKALNQEQTKISELCKNLLNRNFAEENISKEGLK